MPDILFVAFGSAGDLYPVIAVAQAVRARGEDVVFAVNAEVAPLCRAGGFPTASLVHAQSDSGARWDGALEWRHFFELHIDPMHDTLASRLERIIDKSRPKAVVASSLCGWSKAPAQKAGVAWIRTDLVPELDGLDNGRPAPLVPRSDILNVVLHDPILAARDVVEFDPSDTLTGFPGGSEVDVAGVTTVPWQHSAPGECGRSVLCTMGSFLGKGRTVEWIALLRALIDAGLSPYAIGVDESECAAIEQGAPGSVVKPFVPMTSLVESASVVLHHGGIGSTYLSLLAGRPGVVRPIGFDQEFNGKWMQDLGAGVLLAPAAEPEDVAAACVEACRDRRYLDAAAEVAATLTKPGAAADRASALIVDAVRTA